VKVLLADDAERARASARVLAADSGLSVLRLETGESLAETVAALAPDVVLEELIRHRRLSEPDAYKWLRRTAMSSARRIVDVAGDLIKTMEGSAG
jgi:CheY-like chemotaxis protein